MPKRKLEKLTVGQALRQWRKEQGLTRKQAALELGVKVRTLESWEYGYRTPPSMKIAEKFWSSKRRAM